MKSKSLIMSGPHPITIFKFRDGREVNYFAVWSIDSLSDQMDVDEVRVWKRKGVPVVDGGK